MRYLIAIVLGIAFALGGCTAFAPADIPVSQTLSPTAQQAQKALNEANITLTAAYNVVAQNVKDGVWTKEEGRAYVDKLNAMTDQVDNAAKLLKTDPLSAKNQAELLSRAILALHKEIASQARKQ